MSDSQAPDNSRDSDEGIHPYPGVQGPADPGAESMVGSAEDVPVASPSEMEGKQDSTS
jgi:hypothetical protein